MSMAPPPGMAAPQGEFGPGTATQGGPPPDASGMPSPAQPPPPGAAQTTMAIAGMAALAQQIANLNPQLIPIVGQITDLIQQLQMKSVQSMPPSEPAAPPV